jgi:hypothetical protein
LEVTVLQLAPKFNQRSGALRALFWGLLLGIPALPIAAFSISQPQPVRYSSQALVAQKGGQKLLTTLPRTASTFELRVKNNTRAPIILQTVGYTERRLLSGGQEIVLRDLPIPTTIVMARQDNGFINVQPMSMQSAKLGRIGISLNEAKGLNDSQLTVGIQSNGQVIAY